MQVTAKELSDLLDGTLEGDPNVRVIKPSKIEEAEVGSICFLSNAKYESYIYTTKASVLLVSRDFQPTQALSPTLIRVDDVYASIAVLLEKFGVSESVEQGVSEQAFVHAKARLGKAVSIGLFSVVEEGAIIGDNCTIHPQVFVGKNVKIGNNVTLYPGVKIYQDCVIGDNCIFHANVIIGGDGFGFAPLEDGTYKKLAQIGNVIIEENVEIGANSVVDRATMGSTIIRSGAKLDNLIMIAHNVEVGENTVIAAQAGIAGSTKIGKNCMIGGQAGFVGHITIADGVKVQAQSGINTSIKKEDISVYGSPALPYNDYLRSYALFKRLPDMSKKIKELEQKLKELEK